MGSTPSNLQTRKFDFEQIVLVGSNNKLPVSGGLTNAVLIPNSLDNTNLRSEVLRTLDRIPDDTMTKITSFFDNKVKASPLYTEIFKFGEVQSYVRQVNFPAGFAPGTAGLQYTVEYKFEVKQICDLPLFKPSIECDRFTDYCYGDFHDTTMMKESCKTSGANVIENMQTYVDSHSADLTQATTDAAVKAGLKVVSSSVVGAVIHERPSAPRMEEELTSSPKN